MAELRISVAARDPRSASAPALVVGGRVLTFAELGAHAAELGARLRIERGARVAVTGASSFGTLVTILAAMDAGAPLVPIHPRLTDVERAPLLARSGAQLVVGDLRIDPTDTPKIEPRAPVEVAASDPLALLFTSGTTGSSKAALLSRGAFAAAASASAANIGWLDDDRWLLCLPLAHVGGLSIVTRCLAARRPVVLVPRFEPDAVLRAVVEDGATLLSVVPTMLDALLRADRAGVLARLRVVLVGGAATPLTMLEECARRGVRALTTYGLTEACSQVTSQRPKNPSAVERGSGKPLLGVSVRVVDDAGGVARPCVAGRIHVKGAALMDGYERDDGSIDPARTADGWFDTGDLGELDPSGRLFVHARRDDLIVTGGENVYPVEVEQALERVAGVRRALVFGVPDDRWGHVVAAALELDDDAAMERVARESSHRLAPHKRPRLVRRVDELATTSSGKLVRANALARYGPLEPVPRVDGG